MKLCMRWNYNLRHILDASCETPISFVLFEKGVKASDFLKVCDSIISRNYAQRFALVYVLQGKYANRYNVLLSLFSHYIVVVSRAHILWRR
jgi:hypothetical protein